LCAYYCHLATYVQTAGVQIDAWREEDDSLGRCDGKDVFQRDLVVSFPVTYNTKIRNIKQSRCFGSWKPGYSNR
jgi:hypothetical protein